MKLLIKISLFIGLGIINFFIAKFFIEYLLILPVEYTIILLKPSETLNLILYLDLILTISFLLPIIIHNFYKNYENALTKNEKIIFTYYKLFIFLFIMGSIFGYYVSIYLFIPYLMGFNLNLDIQNTISLNYLFNFIIRNMIMFALIFQIPILIKNLIKLKIVKIQTFKKYRKHIFFGILVITAIITPPGIINLIIGVLPLYLLFELSLLDFKKYSQQENLSQLEYKSIF